MRKLLVLILASVLVFSSVSYGVITYTKDYTSANDGETYGGQDIGNFQDDVSEQTATTTGNNAFTGNNTFAGTSTFTGTVTGTSSPKDFIARGFELGDTADDDTTVTVKPGVLYHNDTEVRKTANTTLTFATATDWWDGAADTFAGGADWNYIGVKGNGDVKLLGTNPPNSADSAGNSVGTLFYWNDSANFWRVIGAVFMDTDDQIHASYATTQEGNTVWYIDERAFATTTTSTNFEEEDLTTIVPAVASQAWILATINAATTNMYFRLAGSSATNTQYAIRVVSANNRYPLGWLPLSGGTAAKAIDWRVAAQTGTGYVGAYKLNIR